MHKNMHPNLNYGSTRMKLSHICVKVYNEIVLDVDLFAAEFYFRKITVYKNIYFEIMTAEYT